MMTQRVGRALVAALLAGGVIAASARAYDTYDDRTTGTDDRYDRRGTDQRDDMRATDQRAAGDTAPRERIAPLDRTVRVEDVRTSGDEVSGRIVNESDDEVSNVRLLVSDHFLWNNERHPGTESPSDAHTVTVPGPIAPHGQAAFTFRRPSPLPDRRDGRFVTDVTALEATERPAMARGPYDETGRYQSRGYDRRTDDRSYDPDRYRYDDRY